MQQDVIERLSAAVGDEHCIREPEELRTYEADGLATYRVTPGVVVLPIVARGAGTGLSGGALPVAGCVLIGLSRMRKILEIDLKNAFLRVQPGVINLDVSKRISSQGWYYAPDPSSQSVCTIGGNVAENSGGAHCLKYGFTTNHILGVRMVLADGSVADVGGPVLDQPGYDLLGVIVGSEGLLGIVTEVVLRILRKPEATRTFFATFPSTSEAGNAVSAIIASGIVPAAIEMMDTLAIVAAKAATGLDWPEVGAALLMDVDGPSAECEHTSASAIELSRQCGALEIRVPRDAAERELMWKGRKSAFAAVGRIARNYLVQDGVIPRRKIALVLKEIAALAARFQLRVANVFHAGDGNLHPLILFDARVPGEEKLAEELSGEILRLCIREGGSITGEHGVGADKAAYMPEMFSPTDLETMSLVRCAFDPDTVLNPGKVFPSPRLCGDRPGLYKPHAAEQSGQAERV
jgi:glycolate oxidase